MFEAKVIEDSVSPGSLTTSGVRLTTLQLVYWRGIHSEFMTHRAFSRNASSSRAIPVAKMIKQVRENPAMPIHWGKNIPGMQAGEEIQHVLHAKDLWIAAANKAADFAEQMNDIGLHKQVANRILESYQWIHVVVSATEWTNFFELRAHKDAQPEIQHLAVIMQKAMDESTPKGLKFGEWHLPYVREAERELYSLDVLKKISTARCARVSYLMHNGDIPNIEKDIALHDMLVGAKPIHASPTEHQAKANNPTIWSGNFRGWSQYRAEVEDFLV